MCLIIPNAMQYNVLGGYLRPSCLRTSNINLHIHSLIFSNDSKCGGIYGLSPCLTFLFSAQSLHSFNAHLVLHAVVPGSVFFCTCSMSSSDLGLQNLSFTASIVGGWGSKGLGKEVEFATNMSFSSIGERSWSRNCSLCSSIASFVLFWLPRVSSFYTVL